MVTHTALWAAIEAHEMDTSDAPYPFSKKLRDAQKWSDDFTKTAILEYKRFIYLVAISKTLLSPSKIVDEVWHLHLTYTKDYWDIFCAKVIGRPIHHNPSDGTDVSRFHNAYDDCLKLYQNEFEQAPPTRFWPQMTIKKNPHSWRAFLCLFGVGVLVSGCEKSGSVLPFVGMAMIFIGFMLLFWVVIIGRHAKSTHKKPNDNSGGGCGAGSCSSSSDSSDGGSSCGGCGGD